MIPADRIRAKGLELGFSKVGFARVAGMPAPVGFLNEWLSRGYQATMRWMVRNVDKRQDPGRVVPGAKTIISVAMNYYTPREHVTLPGVGKISRYAWGDDYHDTMRERLVTFHRWLSDEYPEYHGRYYVDTGPVLEKVWAQQAGIGWQGKHSNLITDDMGSWVFLGEIVTTLEIEPDTPATDHCGTCTLCIDACPTHAIVEEYVVDANKCISYLTIEHRDAIPPSLAEDFSSWIYGCDICQDVCPWNQKFARPSAVTAFEPRPESEAVPLESWSRMSQEEFSRRFKGSPVKRTKWQGLLRNIAAVMNTH